jgi:cation transporter-like permease
LTSTIAIASTFPTAETSSGTSERVAATARTGAACIIISIMGFICGFLLQETNSRLAQTAAIYLKQGEQ